MTNAPVVLLGPQRREPNLGPTLRSLGLNRGDTIAVVSAGWEERELEHEELESHVGMSVANLEIHRRVEEIFARYPDLRQAMVWRLDRIRSLQVLYRLQLGPALTAARDLLARDDASDLVDPAREAAIAVVRSVDSHHLDRIRATHAQFEREHPADRYPLLRAFHDRLRREIEPCKALCIAGGHVAILLSRLRISGLLPVWGRSKPIVAWGAGAMVLADRVIVFHDRPPQGPNDTEVFESGFGIAAGTVPLPHAEERLALDDARRVALLARRFAPAECFALESGSRVDLVDGRWSGRSAVRRLEPDGSISEVES